MGSFFRCRKKPRWAARVDRTHPPRAMTHFLGGLFPRPPPDLLPVVLGPLPDFPPPPELPLPPLLPLPITFLLANIHCDQAWKISTTSMKARFVPTLNLSSSRRISMGLGYGKLIAINVLGARVDRDQFDPRVGTRSSCAGRLRKRQWRS